MNIRHFSLGCTSLGLLIAASILLTGCNLRIAETPEQQYYALKAEYRTLLIPAVGYKKDCEASQPAESPCHKHVEVIQKIDLSIGATLTQADKFREQGQRADLAVAMGAVQQGLDLLVNYLGEVNNVKR